MEVVKTGGKHRAGRKAISVEEPIVLKKITLKYLKIEKQTNLKYVF